MNTAQHLLIEQIQVRICEESIPRILKCLDSLSEHDIWKRPNESSNSVGTLSLHIIGNCRQWLLRNLIGEIDNRHRDGEFDLNNQHSKKELIQAFKRLKQDLINSKDKFLKADLTKQFKVQVFNDNGVSIITHAIEHFSYHTGQIALLTKLNKNEDLGFYAHLNF